MFLSLPLFSTLTKQYTFDSPHVFMFVKYLRQNIFFGCIRRKDSEINEADYRKRHVHPLAIQTSRIGGGRTLIALSSDEKNKVCRDHSQG